MISYIIDLWRRVYVAYLGWQFKRVILGHFRRCEKLGMSMHKSLDILIDALKTRGWSLDSDVRTPSAATVVLVHKQGGTFRFHMEERV